MCKLRELGLENTFKHLKRIRKVVGESNENLLVFLCLNSQRNDKKIEQLATDYNAELKDVEIPTTAPLTRAQLITWNHYWPCTLLKRTMFTQPVSTFSVQFKIAVEKHMNRAIELARKAREKGFLPIGGVMVDPATNCVVAEAFDQSRYFKGSSVASTYSKSSTSSDTPLDHCAMLCIKSVATQQCSGRTDFHLCNNFDFFTTREPCVMCSMALLHSRIGRVFYGTSNPEFGGLGSCCCIHFENSLNHRFSVYKNICYGQCESLWICLY